MSKNRLYAIILAALITAAFSPEKKPSPYSRIDWGKGVIKAGAVASFHTDSSGNPVDREDGRRLSLAEARLEASKAARDAALESVVSLIKTITVEPDTEMNDLLETDITSQRRVSRVIASKIKYKEGPAGFFGARCEAELKLGDIIEALPLEYPGSEIPLADDNRIPTVYSSVIIDARETGAVPMIFPSIYNENGLEIFGRSILSIREAARKGAAAYVNDEKAAMAHPKAGRNPYYAAAVSGIKGSPVISVNDYLKITSSPETLNNIKNCRVIIIINRERMR
jgi:hypothetical protein